MKKLLLLLLFIPLVSFGQEDVELNLSVKDSTKNYFGIGFKYENEYDSNNEVSQLYKDLIIIDFSSVINNLYYGFEYGTSIHRNIVLSSRFEMGNGNTIDNPSITIEDSRYTANIQRIGLKFGFRTSNDKFIITSTNGRIIHKFNNTSMGNPISVPQPRLANHFYSKLSIILNSNNRLVPELGVYSRFGSGSMKNKSGEWNVSNAKVFNQNIGFSLGLVYFFKPKSSKNKKLKNNEDVYTELKKLNELLELGIITQEEYEKKAEELKKVILD